MNLRFVGHSYAKCFIYVIPLNIDIGLGLKVGFIISSFTNEDTEV